PELGIVHSKRAAQIEVNGMNDDKPSPLASVILVPDGEQHTQPSEYRQARSDRLGRFAMRNVPPGDYMLLAWEQVENDAYFDPDFLGQYEDRGRAVHVEEGGHLSVQLDAIPVDETVP